MQINLRRKTNQFLRHQYKNVYTHAASYKNPFATHNVNHIFKTVKKSIIKTWTCIQHIFKTAKINEKNHDHAHNAWRDQNNLVRGKLTMKKILKTI